MLNSQHFRIFLDIDMPAFCEELRKSSKGYFTPELNSSSSDLYLLKNDYDIITGKLKILKFKVSGRSCKLLILGDENKEIVVTAIPKNDQFKEIKDRVVLLSCERTSKCKLLTTVIIFGFETRFPVMSMFIEY